MVLVGGKWEVISVQNRKDVYGQTGQWLQVGIDLRGYDAEYQAVARGIRQKTFFVRAQRAMGVDSRWGATLEWAEWRAEHLVASAWQKNHQDPGQVRVREGEGQGVWACHLQG